MIAIHHCLALATKTLEKGLGPVLVCQWPLGMGYNLFVLSVAKPWPFSVHLCFALLPCFQGWDCLDQDDALAGPKGQVCGSISSVPRRAGPGARLPEAAGFRVGDASAGC